MCVYVHTYIYIIRKLYCQFRSFPQKGNFWKVSSEKNQVSSKKKALEKKPGILGSLHIVASSKELPCQSMDCASPVALHFSVIALCGTLKFHVLMHMQIGRFPIRRRSCILSYILSSFRMCMFVCVRMYTYVYIYISRFLCPLIPFSRIRVSPYPPSQYNTPFSDSDLER